jgi:hypothetical protein
LFINITLFLMRNISAPALHFRDQQVITPKANFFAMEEQHKSSSHHHTSRSSLSARRNDPELTRKILEMHLVLCPIRQLPFGDIHPSLPQSVLKYWLLTEDEIDSIARFYHQTDRSHPYFNGYPGHMNWDNLWLRRPDEKTDPREIMQLPTDKERLIMKRRRVGKFIGLRGCQTPNHEVLKRFEWLEGRFERSIEKEREDICGK